MWWNSGPHLARRKLIESGYCHPRLGKRKPKSFFQNDTDIEELLAILVSKYGNVARAWRVALDTDESGLLDFREFSSAMKNIGYIGNLRTLWFNLDDDHSGFVSLKEIDPVSYFSLEKFRALSTRRYGNMRKLWDELLDEDHSGTVSYEEFRRAVPSLGYEDEEEVDQLFSFLLTTPGISYITYHDVKFLQTWEENKQQAAQRKRLQPLWVNKDPYMSSRAGSTVLTSNPSMTSFATQSMIDYGSEIAYNEEQAKDDFRKYLIDRYGSLCKAFHAMDSNRSGSLSMVEFQTVVSTVLRYCRPADAKRLFLSLNEDPDARVSWEELGIQRHDWITFTMERTLRERMRIAEARGDGFHNAAGLSPRQVKGHNTHIERVKNKKKRADVAFGMPLPRGWGFPPNFDPRNAVTLPPLSAR